MGKLWIGLFSGVACLLLGLLSGLWAQRRWGSRDRAPGFVDVQHQSDALAIAITYLTYYRSLFAERRRTVKKRARNAVVATATFNAGIAVVGAVVTLTGWSGLGLASTVLAGAVAVVAAWDGHFRHRDLWVQRSVILQQLEQVLRDVEIKKRGSGIPWNELALEAMSTLDRILKEDIDSWASIRKIDEASRTDLPPTEGGHSDESTISPTDERKGGNPGAN
ncbi:SLATT domain-containing protein [Mycobacterium malmoense]|uniref:SLATT domain-containing protein n=1 Tax=Mycobacterium malmoense TaxID=1780 RepID=UPI0011467C48|nr:SLATT domain-containing protein [Mycobacterium malmoense]